jgi:23S rRNA (guanosine2251-2'-O)-methyltransferase
VPYVTLEELLKTLSEPANLLVIDRVIDPHELGACLCDADAFNAHAVVVPKDRKCNGTTRDREQRSRS